MSYELSDGVVVTVEEPTPPALAMGAPSCEVFVVPVAGPQGTPGAAIGTFSFIQSSPASAWTVPHNLHRHPNISYIDPSGFVWIPDVEHISIDVAYLSFPSPTTGEAACS